MVELIKNEGRQTRFLRFFRTVINCRCSSHLNNIHLIMNTLLPYKPSYSDKWANLDTLYLKQKDVKSGEGQIEFDLRPNDFVSEKDS